MPVAADAPRAAGIVPTVEVWGGAEATSTTWSAYSGMTWAVFGPLLADGWRVRAVGGYGEYSYRSSGATVHGRVTFTDALIGYHSQLGQLTVKGFVGVSAENHTLRPLDPLNDIVGFDVGAKAVVETWLEIDPRAWTSLDLSWSSVHGGGYWGRGRAGYRVWPELSLGLEAAAVGNSEYDGGRGGVFARYAWTKGEATAAVGVSVDRSLTTGAYGLLSVLYRY